MLQFWGFLAWVSLDFVKIFGGDVALYVDGASWLVNLCLSFRCSRRCDCLFS